MAIEKILGTDKLESGFRAKYNSTVDKLIVSIVDSGDGEIEFNLFDGSILYLDLTDSFYTIAQVLDLINSLGITPATEDAPGIIQIATKEEVDLGTEQGRAITPFTAKNSTLFPLKGNWSGTFAEVDSDPSTGGYSEGMIVVYAGYLYMSMENDNKDLPSDQTKWVLIGRSDGLIFGGTIDVSDFDNGNISVDIAKWLLTMLGVQGLYQTLAETTFSDIELSTAGNQRYIAFYGTSENVIIKVEGDESPAAVLPDKPEDTVLIGYTLITDSSAEPPVIDLSEYVKLNVSNSGSLILTGNATFGNELGALRAYITNEIVAKYFLSTVDNTDTINPDTGINAFKFNGGDVALRIGVDKSFNIDTYNSGSPINALKVKQSGDVDIIGDYKSNGVSILDTAKSYADGLVVGLWDDRGNFDASVNAYPSSGGSGAAGAIVKGDIWTISVAGTLPTGQTVEIGDTVRALTDAPSNTQANWSIQQNNIGYVPENSTNKTDAMAGNTASSIIYLSAKGVYDWVISLGYQVASDITTALASFKTTNFLDATSSIQTQIDSKTDKNLPINNQTASYTLVLADNGKLIEMNVASANNLTIPLNSSVAFPIGTQIPIYQMGAGQTTIVATGGVTIRQRETKLKIAGQYGLATLIKRDTDTWVLSGDLAT